MYFHDAKKGRYGGDLFRSKDYLHWEFLSRLYGKGLPPFDRDLNPNIASEEAIAVASQMRDTISYLSPGVLEHGLFDNFKAFAKGNSYCNLGWGGTQKHLIAANSPIKDDLIFLPLPGGAVNGVSF
ncbi:MAG: hypothetical protein HRU19_21830 [Pseudobacteriovorax sp.]|nr:hypothetical protein [Pseudobacteriovorax sp.]